MFFNSLFFRVDLTLKSCFLKVRIVKQAWDYFLKSGNSSSTDVGSVDRLWAGRVSRPDAVSSGHKPITRTFNKDFWRHHCGTTFPSITVISQTTACAGNHIVMLLSQSGWLCVTDETGQRNRNHAVMADDGKRAATEDSLWYVNLFI